MDRREYRRRWLLYHSRYERKGRAMFRRALRKASLNIPFDNLSELLYPAVIASNINIESIEDAYLDFYTEIGLAHGKKVGKNVNKQLKRFEIDFFDIEFRRTIRQWLIENAGTRIVTVRAGLIDDLIRFIAIKAEEGKTMAEIAGLIKRYILSRGFYRWQIERIVRTETTAAANYGASRAGDVSGVLMVKEWVSSNDSRTRRHEREDMYDHLDMEGVRVAKDDFFSVPDRLGGADNILFPGDPKGRPGNVINCRCTVGLVPQRDANGDLIFT